MPKIPTSGSIVSWLRKSRKSVRSQTARPTVILPTAGGPKITISSPVLTRRTVAIGELPVARITGRGTSPSDGWLDHVMATHVASPGPGPAHAGNPQGEKATYVEYLANYRLTLGLKCDGLTPEQLATRSVPPSTMSLLGLVRHMARVENSWFQRVPWPAARTGSTGAPRTGTSTSTPSSRPGVRRRRVRDLAPRDRRGRGVVRRHTESDLGRELPIAGTRTTWSRSVISWCT